MITESSVLLSVSGTLVVTQTRRRNQRFHVKNDNRKGGGRYPLLVAFLFRGTDTKKKDPKKPLSDTLLNKETCILRYHIRGDVSKPETMRDKNPIR